MLRMRGMRREALRVFLNAAILNPNNASLLIVEAAKEHLALGNVEEAERSLNQILLSEDTNLGALMTSAQIAEQKRDLEQAIDLCNRAARAHPLSIWPVLAEARLLFDIGKREEAFASIREARAKFGPHPEFTSLEVDFFRRLRSWEQALNAANDGIRGDRSFKFWLLSHKVEIETIIGRYRSAEASLNQIDASTVAERAQVALLQGRLFEAEFKLERANAAYRQATELAPTEPAAYLDLSRSSLLSLDLEASRSALRTYTQLTRFERIIRGYSLNLSQHHQGQLLEDFFLHCESVTRLHQIRTHSPENQLALFADEVRRFPDATAIALTSLIALRQAGGFNSFGGTSSVRTHDRIPRNIVQFYETSPPEEMDILIRTWNELNPDCQCNVFTDTSAKAFIQQEFDTSVTEAYDRTRYPEQKSDLFRLAYIAARGGVYVDPRSRCLSPISHCVNWNASLVCFQDEYGALGNDFIAATPGHPVIVRALELGVQALNEGAGDFSWLSTGPGLLSRSFTHEWASPRGDEILRATQLLDIGFLQSQIGIRCPVIDHTRERSKRRIRLGRWTPALL